MGSSNHNCERSHVSGEFKSSWEYLWAIAVYDRRHLIPEILAFSCLGFANIFTGPCQWGLVTVGVILGVLAFILKTWNERRISGAQNQRDTFLVERDNLAAENEDLTTRNNALQSSLTNLLDKSLEALANEMDFGGSERISVYLHRAKQRILEGKARHSAYPEYDRFRREVYRDSEGCLAGALRDGESILPSLPDPNQDLKKWQSVQHDQTDLSTERSEKINMKARSIGAFAIGTRQHRIGVVVVESTRINVLDFDKIREIIERETPHLADVLELIGNHSEDAKSLAEEGF